MNSDPQISQWIMSAQAGDREAITRLWNHYYPQLVRLARTRLAGAPQQMADAEDVAASAIKSFWKAAEKGRFPDLHDRNGLGRLLFKMTARKVVDHWRRETCEANGGGKVLNEAQLDDSQTGTRALEQCAGVEETPEFLALMAEACEERLKVLTPQLRQLALAKLEGYTNRETGERLGSTEHAVEYGLRVIRKKWRALEARESEKISGNPEKEDGNAP